ncbi:MAG: ABC transporter ATP-binding protein, partial [Erysipelotrichaceae bacterium]|nr:ABC transporter ATP-binding protein [Erysipelotrichaceae bacterium]
RGVTLSGGQKQRISIARAYMKNAPIMIMDDSVSAVDVKTEETILNNINEKRKGKTTIIIASRVSTVAHMDKILVLNEGNVEAFDTPAGLLKTSPTYQKMVYLQKLESEL